MWRILETYILIFIASSLVEANIPTKHTLKNLKPYRNQITPRKLSDENGTINYRLPNNTRPLHYDIHLTTHVHESKFEFEGHVVVKFEPKSAPLNEITLHMFKLKNIKVKLLDINKTTLADNLESDFNVTTDFLTIKTENNLTIGENYYLEFDYEGELRDDNVGFYKSSYMNEKNEIVWLATTQFESVEARSAFPW